ncbi:MAG TPA: ribonuclease HII [Hellea balneolensis]|uniref:Ribonuclease HII n=1 Tax=Hellea balneolensis TaxID=287478 RepID=A0A7V5U1J3_9PROT|nr:ribonuclease HII [Hellea balneolensis]
MQEGGEGLIAGVDEAGRGPLAGPVVAAAVILVPGTCPDGLNDSKILSHRQREQLYTEILTHGQIGIGLAEPEEIDRLNILWASMVAMQRAVADLPLRPHGLLVDGNRCPEFDIPARAIVRGDRKSLSIAAASIVAKVTRDRLMGQACVRFPHYNLSGHKGYPTKAHRELLRTHGPCPVHRRSFAPVRDAWAHHRSRPAPLSNPPKD